LTDRMNVLLARYSAAFANRERVSRRVLALLPGYEESAQRVNDLLREPEEAQASAPTYGRLERFVREVVGSGAELVLAAMPTRAGYDLDPELVRVAGRRPARASSTCATFPASPPRCSPTPSTWTTAAPSCSPGTPRRSWHHYSPRPRPSARLVDARALSSAVRAVDS